jgi:hypothetical protein
MPGSVRRSLLTALLVCLCAAPGVAEDAEVEDVLGGFDAEPTEDVDDVDDADAALGGFDDDTSDGGARSATDEASEPWWDFTGSTSLGLSYNLRNHRSSLGPPPNVAYGTFYGNVQRFRWRLDGQLDLKLPFDWKLRAQAFAWHDFAYLMHGREKYTQLVLDDYESRAEVLDFWIQGSVTSWLDLKLGRQVVNWGRSDSLRVNDIINPLNNLEPGLADIEDLRLPVTMVKADFYWGPWRFEAMVIPELRYDWDPPPGSDFFPSDPLILAFLAAGGGEDLPDRSESQWGAVPEFAGSITGIFSGWDVSLYVARTYQNRTSTVLNLPGTGLPPAFLDDDLITMVGGGGNYTRGSWLFKAEMAWFDELDYSFITAPPNSTIDNLVTSRIDWMAGVEYYGVSDLTVALEFAHRYIVDYTPLLRPLPNYAYQHSIESALRMNYDMMNARLHLLGLAVVLLNEEGFVGSIVRLQVDYDLMDALVLSGGLVYYVGSDFIPFDTWADNDRLFAKLKWSF